MSETAKRQPLYEKDPETGKITLLPLPDHLFTRSSAQKKSAQKSSEKKTRKFVNLKPLVLGKQPEDEVPKKKIKLSLSAASKAESSSKMQRVTGLPSRRSYNVKSANKHLRLKQAPKIFVSDHSPLPNLDDVEEELINTDSALTGFPFKSPKSIQQKFNFTKKTPKTLLTPSRMSVISEEISPNDTFIENEIKCLDEVGGVIEMLEDILRSEEHAFVQQTRRHEEVTSKIKSYIRRLKSKTGKENVTGNLLTTPQSGKKENLRKKVLMTNFESNLQTPRTRGAVSLYNSLRSTNSMLQTPRLNRQVNEDSPGGLLANALMKQCLLLQSTPAKK